MPRWALLIEYDGGGFAGWQRQPAEVTVQAVLEEAAAKLAGAPVSSIVAGRTDAGVHALGQVAHMDLAREITGDKLVAALNFHMRPHRVAVLQAVPVAARWSARFSAVGRRYRYVMLNRPARAALDEGRVWHVKPKLDVAAMREAAAMLVGKHDFTSFRAASCQAASPVRTLDVLEVVVRGDCVDVVADARSFLHHQVRNLVGTLKLVGLGQWAPARVGLALAARDRAAGGPTAPPEGLVMEGVRYPEAVFAGMDGGRDFGRSHEGKSADCTDGVGFPGGRQI